MHRTWNMPQVPYQGGDVQHEVCLLCDLLYMPKTHTKMGNQGLDYYKPPITCLGHGDHNMKLFVTSFISLHE